MLNKNGHPAAVAVMKMTDNADLRTHWESHARVLGALQQAAMDTPTHTAMAMATP
jgi:hypothetical protein